MISNYSVYALDDPGDLLPIEKVTCNGEVSRVTLVDPIDTGTKYVLKADGIRDMVGNMSHTSGHFGYMADMSVSGLSADPDHLTDGSTPIDISFTLENTGNFEADSFTVSFWLKTVDDGLEEEYLLGRVAFEEFPDSSSLVDTIHVLPPAEAVEENYIVARVDDEGLIVEWDEENNEEEIYLYSYMPRIISIADVPDDMGGWVNIEFYRSSVDGPGVTDPVAAYQVYRRDITVTAAAGPASGSAAGAPLAPGIYSLDDYTMIASVDADGLDEYSVAVETNMDSAEDNVHVDEFFVRAVRVIGGEPVFYYSVPDSGSSINNLIGPEDALDCFHASAENGGVRIVWQLLDPDGGAGFTVSRSQEGGPWAPLSGDILNPREGFYVFLDDGVEPGQDYSYRVHLKTGDSSYLLFETETIRTPAVRLALFQNVPNPFNPSTEISYFLPQAESVSLDIFDVAGRRIKTLANGIMREGDHRVEWDGRDNNGSRVASGVYFYRLRAGKDTLTRKMVLLR